MQYSREFRDKVRERVLTGGDSQEALATEVGIGRSTIRYWLRGYRRVHAQSVSKKDERASAWSRAEQLEALLGDGVGDDDGLCESNEDCLVMPHPGAFQGAGGARGCRNAGHGGKAVTACALMDLSQMEGAPARVATSSELDARSPDSLPGQAFEHDARQVGLHDLPHGIERKRLDGDHRGRDLVGGKP